MRCGAKGASVWFYYGSALLFVKRIIKKNVLRRWFVQYVLFMLAYNPACSMPLNKKPM